MYSIRDIGFMLVLCVSTLVGVVTVLLYRKHVGNQKSSRQAFEGTKEVDETTLRTAFRSNNLVRVISNQINSEISKIVQSMYTASRYEPTIEKFLNIEVYDYRVKFNHNTVFFNSDNPSLRYENLKNEKEIDIFLQTLVELIEPKLEKFRRKGTSISISFSESHPDADDYYKCCRLEFSKPNRNYDNEKKSWY